MSAHSLIQKSADNIYGWSDAFNGESATDIVVDIQAGAGIALTPSSGQGLVQIRNAGVKELVPIPQIPGLPNAGIFVSGDNDVTMLLDVTPGAGIQITQGDTAEELVITADATPSVGIVFDGTSNGYTNTVAYSVPVDAVWSPSNPLFPNFVASPGIWRLDFSLECTANTVDQPVLVALSKGTSQYPVVLCATIPGELTAVSGSVLVDTASPEWQGLDSVSVLNNSLIATTGSSSWAITNFAWTLMSPA